MEKKYYSILGDGYLRIIFWLILTLLVISIVTSLLSPYLKYFNVVPYRIDMNNVYLIILLLLIPTVHRIIGVKYGAYEITLAEERRERERKEFAEKIRPAIPIWDGEDNKLKFLLENKQYFEGFGYYSKKLEEAISNLLLARNIRSRGGLNHLFNLAHQNHIIDSFTQKRIAIFLEAKNKFVHFGEKIDLDDEQLRNILILVAYSLKKLKEVKK